MAGSLDLLQFQPYRFGFTPETCANNDNREYCNLVQGGDNVSYQARRTRGAALGCSLLDIDSTQLITNSGFTGGAGVPWSLSGGWAYGTDDVSISQPDSGHVWQAVAALIDKGMYKVVVVTTAISLGGINVLISGTTIGTIPDGALAGTFTFYGIADTAVNTNVGINGTNISSTVTSITLFRAAPCYTFDVTDGTISYDEIFGIAINGSVSIEVTLPFEVSNTYSPKTTIFTSNYQTGTVTFGFDGDISPTEDGANGYTSWTNNGTNIAAPVGISFFQYIGNIQTISFEQLSSDYYFALYDLDGTFVQSLNTFVTYCRDYVIISFNPQDEGMNYGCYQIGLYDPYLHNDQLEFEYDFTTLGAPWTVVTGSVWALTGGVGYEYDSASANGAIDTDEAAPDFFAAWTKLRFKTGTLSGTGVGTLSMGIELQDGSLGSIAAYSVIAASNNTYVSTSEGYAPLQYVNFGFVHPKLFVTGTVAADHLEFKNAYYKVYPFHLDYLSNCFTFKESVPCSKLIVAYPGVNMGFNSTNCSFSIQQRFRNLRIIPNYKINASDFIGSDGTRVLISGTMQKVYTLLFDYMDELAHDVVAALLMCKVVDIIEDGSSDINNAKRYFLIPQDYQPEWEKDGKLNIAMGRINMIEYDQVKFTTNCQ